MRTRKGLLYLTDADGGGGNGPATMENLLAQVKGIGDRFEEKMKAIVEEVAAKEEARKKEHEALYGQVKELGGDMDKFADESRKRMRLVQRNMFQGGRYRGVFTSPEQAKSFGLFALSVLLRAKEPARADKYLGLLKETPDFASYEKAMSNANDAAGGVLSPEEFSTELIREVENFGTFRQHARRVPLAGDRKNWPRRKTGLNVFYPDENVTVTESELGFDRVAIEPIKYATLTAFSSEFDEDSIVAIGELIALEAAQAFAEAEDDNGFNGDGTSAFARTTGILNSTAVQVLQFAATNTTFGALTYDNLIDTQTGAKGYVTRPAWYMTPTVLGIVRKLKDTNGDPIISDTPLSVGEPRTLLGDPVVIARKMPKAGDTAANKAFIIYGQLDLSHYFGTRREIRLARSEEIGFKEDMIYVKVTQRVGIAERQPEAVTIVKTAAS